MKKLLAVGLMFLTGVAFAGNLSQLDVQHIQKTILSAVQKDPLSVGAHDEGVIPVTFYVLSKFDEPYARVQLLEKSCSAVRISANYLLASMACVGLSETADKLSEVGGELMRIANVPVAWRKIKSVRVDNAGETISEDNIKYDKKSRLILIHWDAKNDRLQAKIGSLPIPNLFVPRNAEKLAHVFPQAIVNRSYYFQAFGRTTAEVKVEAVNSQTGCLNVEWKLVDGQTGSPLFGIASSNEEFLLGFNAAEPDGMKATSSSSYYFLNDYTIPFLKRNMDADAFATLTKKIVDESYFK